MQNLNEEESSESVLLRATNRYCGFVKCIASILWTAHTTALVNNLEALITEDLFEAVFHWTTILTDGGDPFKQSIDSMLCSICAIRPELFKNLLIKMGITPLETNMSDDRKVEANESANNAQAGTNSASMWLTRDQLLTLALTCQSKLAVQQLIDSGLPEKLTKYCAHVFRRPKSISISMEDETLGNDDGVVRMEIDEDVPMLDNMQQTLARPEESEKESVALNSADIDNCCNIIDFFTDMCTEGLMRDWLGSPTGSCFWFPLLYRLCHARLLNERHEIGTKLTDLEKATIRFLSQVTTCHPNNQELATRILITVIQKPETVLTDKFIGARQSISGFTRRLILDLLLENEKILVAVHSPGQLTKKELPQNEPILSNHPSKRPNAHNIYLFLSTNAKAIEILDNCRPAYSSYFNNQGAGGSDRINLDDVVSKEDSKLFNGILGELSEGNLLNGPSTVAMDATGEDGGKGSGYWKSFTSSLLEMDQTPELLSMAAGVTAKDKRLKDVKNHAAVLRAKESMSE